MLTKKNIFLISGLAFSFILGIASPDTANASGNVSPASTSCHFQIRNYSSETVQGIAIRTFQRGHETERELLDLKEEDQDWIIKKSYSPAIHKYGRENISVEIRGNISEQDFVVRIYYGEKNKHYFEKKVQFSGNPLFFNVHDGWFESISYAKDSQ